MDRIVSRSDTQFRDLPQLGSPALSVDLDAALLRTDPVYERLFYIFRTRPFLMVPLGIALLQGRQRFRRALLKEAGPDFRMSSFPRQAEVEELVDSAQRQNKPVDWFSREPLSLEAEEPAFQQIFEGRSELLSGEEDGQRRAEQLRARHPDGFAHVGRRAADLPLWRAASERYGVNLPASVRRQAEREGLGIVELAQRRPLLPSLLRSMRPHQWLKNLLVFVPFGLDVGQLHLHDVAAAIVAFACLCLLTSGTYLINDLFDVEADRGHPRKCKRPIASGDVPIPTAAIASVGLVVLALGIGLALRAQFAAALACYLVLTLAYSFRLKRMAMVDVLVIAMLFTLRILSGMLLVNSAPSHWLPLFSIFFFLSLAFMKREVEFNVMHRAGREVLNGRGYAMEDRMYVLSCGLSSGMASIVIFSLFVTETLTISPANYGAPMLLWGVMAFLSYWVLRMWLLTTRGLMNDDPILFAARDRTSLLLGGASALLLLCAQVLRF